MLSSFYGTDSKTLPVYLELYGTDNISDNTFLLSHRIINMKDASEIPGFTRTSKLYKSSVVPVFETINIEELNSGNYQIEYRLTNNSNEILAFQTYDFERSNDNNYMFTMENMLLDPAFQSSIPSDSTLYFL